MLLAAAFLTKQNGLAEGVAVLAALAAGPRRRLAWPAALTYGAVLGVSTLVLGLASHGWYLYYVFEQMGEQSLKTRRHRAVLDYVAAARCSAVAVCAAVLGARRTPLVLLAGCAALVVGATPRWCTAAGPSTTCCPPISRWRCSPGWRWAASPAAWSLTALDRLARARHRDWRRGPGRALGRAAASGLVIVQLAVLVSGFRPGQAIPASADRAVGARLTAGVRALGGTVAVPADPGLDLMAGLPG